MECPEYEKMFRLEDSYWWYVGRRRLVHTLLRNRLPSNPLILDLGCGTGAMSQELQHYGRVISLDRAEPALQLARTRGLKNLCIGDAEALPFKPQLFDLVVALDVLEHLDKDLSATQEIARVLKPGGIALVTVPACPLLWSDHDVALHHRRRYTFRQLHKALEKGGLRVQLLSYTMTLLFPLAVLGRLANKIKRRLFPRRPATTQIPPTPGVINQVLIRLLSWEAEWARRAYLPFGVSLVSLATKPQ